ncbi:hypothetical protein ACFQ3Z_09240 [Streptomyces nogalater]
MLLDGEEEIGSPNLAAAVRQVGQPDLVIWSDGPVHESGRECVVLGVRGILMFELRARGASRRCTRGTGAGSRRIRRGRWCSCWPPCGRRTGP